MSDDYDYNYSGAEGDAYDKGHRDGRAEARNQVREIIRLLRRCSPKDDTFKGALDQVELNIEVAERCEARATAREVKP